MMPIVAEVAANGRVVVPLEYRKRLGLERGGSVVFDIEDDELVLRSKRQMAKRAQERLRPFLADYKGSIVEDLSADRRAEFEQEEREFNAAQSRE